jgi:hypothetical protein
MFHNGYEQSGEGALEGTGAGSLFFSHLEGMDLSRRPSLAEIGQNVYAHEDLLGSAARQEWQRLAGSEAAEAFGQGYEQYVSAGEALAQQAPERYAFLREHVFAGQEFLGEAGLEQIDRGIEALWDMEALWPAVWERLSVEERLSALQEVEQRLAAVEGRPAVEVVAAVLGPHTNGEYDFREIRISAERLSQDDVAGLVETVAHEGRHCYQHYAIWYPWRHHDQAEVQAWRVNFEPGNYLTADKYGYELYRNQPIEADAWAFAEAIRKGLYGTQGAEV